VNAQISRTRLKEEYHVIRYLIIIHEQNNKFTPAKRMYVALRSYTTSFESIPCIKMTVNGLEMSVVSLVFLISIFDIHLFSQPFCSDLNVINPIQSTVTPSMAQIQYNRRFLFAVF